MVALGEGTQPSNESRSNTSTLSNDGKTIQKAVSKLRSILGKVVNADKVTPRPAVIEKDYKKWSCSNKKEYQIPCLRHSDLFDLFEYRFCVKIGEQLERLFTIHEKKRQNCDFMVPSDLSSRIAQDVLRMSQNEPCGIRGCELFITLQDKSTCRKMGVIDCDPSTVATFELYLTVKVDRRPSAIMKSMLISIKDRVVHGNSNTTKVLRPDYQLTKRKLHRPN
ncbi:DNA damage-inducible transcript 4-like protein [Liolophura sinensis]|uniref:DNA damage-inducible transcript 4-like protein n=1 Tax=Liolophura sinensis TaxID=3198878 RepID=UPI003158CF67